MTTAPKPMDRWQDVPWRAIERNVFKLQKRIYRASCRGDVRTVRKLQRLLLQSRSGRLLATRRVTQDNQGKKTAGIDGVKKLMPVQRLKLSTNLRLSSKAVPVRRVYIPKPGGDGTEKRPLGIPTMQDRARQALVKLALEPEWEARFEPNSYGFRPGRSCHDAIRAIFDPAVRTPVPGWRLINRQSPAQREGPDPGASRASQQALWGAQGPCQGGLQTERPLRAPIKRRQPQGQPRR
jgi:RNA-directed DNA polymerase